MSTKMPIYLDYQASTPCDPRVIEKMLPFFYEIFGNPHADTHVYGWTAAKAVEDAREEIASVIGAKPEEIFFTSGASESTNLAIKGCARFAKDHPARPRTHIVTCAIEHKSVLESCKAMGREGFSVTFLPVAKDGHIDLDMLSDSITDQTCLVSIMAVNNEIGTINPLKEIGEICRSKGVYFHVDAAQGFAKIPLDVEEMNIDLMSISGHKVYGPKGIGAIFIRRRPRVNLYPILHGGGQEKGIRSGTVPVPLCVGFGQASTIMDQEKESEWHRITALRDKFLLILQSELPRIYINGDMEHRLPNNLNICFESVEGEGLMTYAREVAMSGGSACSSAILEPSYVIKALGISDELANTAVRISFGRYTTEEDAKSAAAIIIAAVNRLRSMSPLWEGSI